MRLSAVNRASYSSRHSPHRVKWCRTVSSASGIGLPASSRSANSATLSRHSLQSISCSRVMLSARTSARIWSSLNAMAFLSFLSFEHVAHLFDIVTCSFERPTQRPARVMTEFVDGVPRKFHLHRDLIVRHPVEFGQQHVPLVR